VRGWRRRCWGSKVGPPRIARLADLDLVQGGLPPVDIQRDNDAFGLALKVCFDDHAYWRDIRLVRRAELSELAIRSKEN
jgi:hypothetical protein